MNFHDGHTHSSPSPMHPVLRADGARATAFHRVSGSAAADVAHTLLLLAKRPELRLCLALPEAAVRAPNEQRSLRRALTMRPRAADRLILALPEMAVAEGFPSAAGPDRPGSAVLLQGMLPANPATWRRIRPDFAILPASTPSDVMTVDGAFLFGLLRQIADRFDVGIMVDGVRTQAQRERLCELGADYLCGPAIAAPGPPVLAL
ncbi:MAG: EAL domain-containing protein [Pseudomonadota bacterium]